MKRWLLFITIAGMSVTSLAREPLHELLRSHCVDCHDRYTTEGELDLTELLASELAADSQARVLTRVRSRVESGEMPPKDAETLSSDQRQRLTQLLTDELATLAESLRDDPGEVAMARLTPYEYRNVIRDLSGGVVTDAGRLLPNEGGAGEGFANVGAAQVMTLSQLERYVDAAKESLKHLRVYPVASDAPSPSQTLSAVWLPYPRDWVDERSAARKEVVDEIIAWYVGQQQKWGEQHRNDLEQQLGFVHSAYLEAAWRFHHREHSSDPVESYAFVRDENGRTIRLSTAALAKWHAILTSDRKDSPHASWAAAWRELPKRLTPDELRTRCVAIVTGEESVAVETEDYAPRYEISFHEAKEEILEAAENEKRWPFRIDVGDAEELFLVVTDAGDGGRGEYAVWRQGRFLFRDGSSKPWQEAVTILGANSGREYPWGVDGENAKSLSEDAVGAKPPGALKFTVPENTVVFEVDLTLDENRTEVASIQALVLKEKPKSQSYIPGRFVFGGKKRPVSADVELKKEQRRALRKRNIAEANRTKIGLNAERNVLASWDRSPIEAIGGPWPDQDADQFEPDFPYHYTVPEVIRNATEADLSELHLLEDRLASLIDGREETSLQKHAEQIIRPFARAAWRRPVTDQEVNSLLNLYRESRDREFSFDSSVKSSLLAVLTSPHFLYRGVSRTSPTELDREPLTGGTELSSFALASRLSFFLWASLPDEELLELAADDKLRDRDVLISQSHRMLQDPRSTSLATDFAGQMWDFTDFDTFNNPDEERFTEFTPELRQAMLDEVTAFLADLMQNDRPLTHLLDSDYTFTNETLADHYGIRDARYPDTDDRKSLGTTAHLTRVKLPPHRGGLATMGLFLTKTSLPLRTSPVQRGVWLMENLLGRHLPNPPANIPPLSEEAVDESGLTIREQLERHRADSSCASCHDKIDPLGVSLEGFDAIGRSVDAEIDVITHDGVTLDGAGSLKAYLVENREEVFEHFNRKLLGYALGRATHVGDQALLDRMSQRLTQEDYQFSSLVEEIVTSNQFRTRKAGSDE